MTNSTTVPQKQQILVVDDDRDIVGFLTQLLTIQGYDVAQAYDGVEALEKVEESLPDLILMDLMMPRMDGRTAIQHLSKNEATHDIPVIVLSANLPHDPAERRKILSEGVRKILGKPTPIQELMLEVRKQLPVD